MPQDFEDCSLVLPLELEPRPNSNPTHHGTCHRSRHFRRHPFKIQHVNRRPSEISAPLDGMEIGMAGGGDATDISSGSCRALQGSLHKMNLCRDPCKAVKSYRILSRQRYPRSQPYHNMGSIEQPPLFIIPDHQRKIKSAQDQVQSIRYAISRTHQTHVLLRVSLSGHCAAIHLIISPFNIQQYQEQTFFSSSYGYNLCCAHSESVITPPLIANYVQTIYDTYYQPCQWDFLPKQSYVSNKHEYCTPSLTRWFGVGNPYVTL